MQFELCINNQFFHVEIYTHGEFRDATRETPAETPTIEILGVERVDGDPDAIENFDADRAREEITDRLRENEPDPPIDPEPVEPVDCVCGPHWM
ncbi:MAG: hypothetical protein ABEN55_08725 [Bradymonadaceae bacterium]